MKKQNLRASGGVTDTQRARVRFMASAAIIQPDPINPIVVNINNWKIAA
jgi:hypothetical protein